MPFRMGASIPLLSGGLSLAGVDFHGVGGYDCGDGQNHHDDARTGPVQGNSGRSRRAGKGRVERGNLTLQDCLVKELRLRHIDTQEAANAYRSIPAVH